MNNSEMDRAVQAVRDLKKADKAVVNAIRSAADIALKAADDLANAAANAATNASMHKANRDDGATLSASGEASRCADAAEAAANIAELHYAIVDFYAGKALIKNGGNTDDSIKAKFAFANELRLNAMNVREHANRAREHANRIR